MPMLQPTAPTISRRRCSQAASHALTTAGGAALGAGEVILCLSCSAKAEHPVNPVVRRLLDHPPEPVIGPATSGRTRWRMMTGNDLRLIPDYRITTTGVPTPTRPNKSVTSSLNMRMQPCETKWPIELGWLVPWMA